MSWPLDLFDRVLIVSKIHLLTESSIQWLKQQAKALKKSKSIVLAQAQYEIAIEHGYSNWKHLIDTFKHENSSRCRFRHIKYDRSLLVPFEDESKTLQTQILSSQGIDQKNLNKNLDIGISEDSTSAFYSLISQALTDAKHQIATKYGFCDWEELEKKYIKELIEKEYTLEQKIGAISRRLGKNPFLIKNTIHVAIEIDNDGLIGLDVNDWEQVGFVEDHIFSAWIEKNDPYFGESYLIFFRVISTDTKSYSTVENHLIKIGSKLDLFFPLYAKAIWINGKIDKNILQSIKEDHLYHIPDIDLESIDYPLTEIPTEIWKGGY